MNDADADKADTLRAIIVETQRLRQNALRDGLDSVAELCEQATNEARAQLAEIEIGSQKAAQWHGLSESHRKRARLRF